MYVHSSLLHKNPKLDTTPMIHNSWMNQQIVVYSSTETVHNENKEWTITLNNMNKSQKHCTKQKTPDAKDCILYDSMYMKSQKN